MSSAVRLILIILSCFIATSVSVTGAITDSPASDLGFSKTRMTIFEKMLNRTIKDTATLEKKLAKRKLFDVTDPTVRVLPELTLKKPTFVKLSETCKLEELQPANQALLIQAHEKLVEYVRQFLDCANSWPKDNPADRKMLMSLKHVLVHNDFGISKLKQEMENSTPFLKPSGDHPMSAGIRYCSTMSNTLQKNAHLFALVRTLNGFLRSYRSNVIPIFSKCLSPSTALLPKTRGSALPVGDVGRCSDDAVSSRLLCALGGLLGGFLIGVAAAFLFRRSSSKKSILSRISREMKNKDVKVLISSSSSSLDSGFDTSETKPSPIRKTRIIRSATNAGNKGMMGVSTIV